MNPSDHDTATVAAKAVREVKTCNQEERSPSLVVKFKNGNGTPPNVKEGFSLDDEPVDSGEES